MLLAKWLALMVMGCLSVWNGFCQIHFLHEVFFVAEVLLEKIPDNKNTPPVMPKRPSQTWIEGPHYQCSSRTTRHSAEKNTQLFHFFPTIMDENENRIKYAVSSCYHDHGFNEEWFNVEDLEWRSESPIMLINVATKEHRSKHSQKQHRAEHLKMSRWVYDFYSEHLIWKRFMHLEPTCNIDISWVVSTYIYIWYVMCYFFFVWNLRVIPSWIFSLNSGGKLPTNYPVFFVTIRMWCSLSGEKPSSVPFPELVRSVPIRGGDCFLKDDFAGCQRLIVCSECPKESYKVFKQ